MRTMAKTTAGNLPLILFGLLALIGTSTSTAMAEPKTAATSSLLSHVFQRASSIKAREEKRKLTGYAEVKCDTYVDPNDHSTLCPAGSDPVSGRVVCLPSGCDDATCCIDVSTKDYVRRGCAADLTDGTRVMRKGPIRRRDIMSAEICYSICADELPGFEYFGTQNSDECFCSKTLPGYVTFDHRGCTSSCKGNSRETCGGWDALTVYQNQKATPSPEYGEMGCAADLTVGSARVMPVGPIDGRVMSAEICYSLCADAMPGFKYFGTQYSFECFCSKTLPGYVTFDHGGCTSSCKGNRGETCGGKDALTVYHKGTNPPRPRPRPKYEEMGCAEDLVVGSTRVMPVGPIDGRVMSAEICYFLCADAMPGFEYFGTQYSFECFCSKTLPGYVTFDHGGCTSKCKNKSEETCGGTDALTVYQQKERPRQQKDKSSPPPRPEYKELGCAEDKADGRTRVLPEGPIDGNVMSAEICYSICAERLPDFKYFGTEDSRECFCSKTLPDYVSFGHNGCTDKCKGNSGETCGGYDAITIYQVGKDGSKPTRPTPMCGNVTPGILEYRVCCPTSCGSCSGHGCDSRDGGDDFSGSQACCAAGVNALGRKCSSDIGAPCMMD